MRFRNGKKITAGGVPLRKRTFGIRGRRDRWNVISPSILADAGYAGETDGINDWVSGSNVIGGPGLSTLSISFWAYLSGTLPNTADNNRWLMGVGNPSNSLGSREVSWAVAPRAGQTTQLCFHVSTTGDDSPLHRITTPGVNAWHQHLIAYDGPGATINWYVDGVAQAVTENGPIQSPLLTSSLSLSIGSRDSGAVPRFMKIDNLAFYHNTVLGQTHATAHYNGGTPPDLMTTTGSNHLSHYFDFNDQSTFPTLENRTGSLDMTVMNSTAGEFFTPGAGA